MPSINEVIERVARLRPVQALEDGDMARWLLELEGRMWNVLVGTSDLPRQSMPLTPLVPPAPQDPAEPPAPLGQEPEGQTTITIPMTPLTPAWPPLERAKVWPEDGDKPLLAPPPYDRVYDFWLISSIEFALREYSSYNNSVLLYNEAYQEFAAWFRRQFRGKPGHGFTHVFP